MNNIASTGIGDSAASKPGAKPASGIMRFSALADFLNVSVSKLYRLRDTDPDFRATITIFRQGSYPYLLVEHAQQYVSVKVERDRTAQRRKPGRPRRKLATKK